MDVLVNSTAATFVPELLLDIPAEDIPAILAQRYPRARAKANGETGLPVETFPPTCPWTSEQVLAADFWPEG